MEPTGRSAVPRFSIVIPVYKVQGYLCECLDSVLAQSFRDFEIITVDDCSPDGGYTFPDGFYEDTVVV
jgi:CDP-glycerol glycerophosphotransferase